MITTLITGPTKEPITVYDAKTHMRVTSDADNVYISGLIRAARHMVEQITGRRLITQTWELRLDDWPCCDYIELPYGSLQSVTSVKYTDTDDTENTFSTDDYSVDTSSIMGRVVLDDGESWPTDALAANLPIVVKYICGYGDNAIDIPGPLIQAVKFGVADMYENRESVVVGTITSNINIVDQLIAPYRLYGYHL